MTSPFASAAPQLREKGYSALPLDPMTKRVTITGWTEYCARLPTDEEHGQWMGWQECNIGVCLGSSSGIIALDFDDDVDGLHDSIVALIPESPVRKRGQKGFTSFYRYNGEKTVRLSSGGVRVLEILSHGTQTVLPPSIHPNGNPYEWMTPHTLLDSTPDDLPSISAGSLRAILALFRTEPTRPSTDPYHEPYRDTSPGDIQDALRFIPSDDYDTWLRIGMAIKTELGEGGMQLWDAWSRNSSRYSPSEIPKKWRSFRRNEVQIATLFYMAMDRGYVRMTFSAPEAVQQSVIEPGGNLTPDAVIASPPKRAEKKAPSPDMDKLAKNILDAPGLPGMVSQFIDQTSLYRQPLLGLAASLSFSGMIMGHRVRNATDLRTNLYTLGIAESGSGKDHARKVCKSLLSQAGLAHLEMGVPASSASLKSHLLERKGRALILIDEFGKYFKAITSKQAGSHQTEIIETLMEIYTSSNMRWQGKAYADTKLNPTLAVDQPCLCLYPVTTPDHFYGNLSILDVTDGFLARFLIFESADYPTEEEENIRRMDDVPGSLMQSLEYWEKHPINNGGNMPDAVCPRVVPFTDQAARMKKEFTLAGKLRAADAISHKNPYHAVYGRVGELAARLALIGHSGDNITAEVMEWAMAVATYSAEYIVNVIRTKVGENELERHKKRVLSIIANLCENGLGEAQHSDVIRKTQFLPRKERLDILEDAVVSGELLRYSRDQGGKPGPNGVYYRLGK